MTSSFVPSGKTHHPHKISCTLSPTLPKVSIGFAIAKHFGADIKSARWQRSIANLSLVHRRRSAVRKLINFTKHSLSTHTYLHRQQHLCSTMPIRPIAPEHASVSALNIRPAPTPSRANAGRNAHHNSAQLRLDSATTTSWRLANITHQKHDRNPGLNKMVS
jgi:hypothetical protein